MNKKEAGQSLTEMAVITPILIIMLICLIEVGWFMWGYMNILSISRESARFAARSLKVSFEEQTVSGYPEVITHTLINSTNKLRLKEQIAADQAQVIITIIGVKTGIPCYPEEDCFAHKENSILTPICEGVNDFPNDDIFASPAITASFIYVYPFTTSKSLITDYSNLLLEKKVNNDKLNCLFGEFSHRNWAKDISVIVEIYYEQPQLLGFPLLTILKDPVPIYAKSVFRVEN